MSQSTSGMGNGTGSGTLGAAMKDWMMPLQADQIRGYLPHRFPFSLVDRILEIRPGGDTSKFEAAAFVGTQVKGLKNVTQNEPHFPGHFPEKMLMPGVLMIETAAQVASFVYQPYFVGSGVDHTKYLFFLTGVTGARFRKPVVPGDSLHIQATLTKAKGGVAFFEAEIAVEGRRVFETELMSVLTRQP